jgi:hypothetical protein
MAPHLESGSDWILLSTAVARMSELHSVYRSHTGYALRDLETAIRAGRAVLRGSWTGAPDQPLVPVTEPLAAKLDLHHNTLSRRTRPGPLGYETVFRNVQIEWIGLAQCIRANALALWGADHSSDTSLERADKSPQPAAISADHSGDTGLERADKSLQPAAISNRKTRTGLRAKHELRDKAIMERLRNGARPGQDPECSWKTFCHSIRKDANGWISGSKLPKRGFSDKSIQRVTRVLQLQRDK